MSTPKIDVPSWTTDKEREFLASLAAEVPAGGLIVEIGSLYGGTAVVLARNAPRANLICIDEFSWTPSGHPTATKQLLEKNLKDAGILNATVIEGKSETVGLNWKKPIDLCFIDGGHSYQFVFADLVNFSQHSKVIACHDYGNPFWETIEAAVADFIQLHVGWKLDTVVDTVAVLRRE